MGHSGRGPVGSSDGPVSESHAQMTDDFVRRGKFIDDIVAVCLKHKVMISPYGNDLDRLNADEVRFDEHSTSTDWTFSVSIGDLEDAIRANVWDVIYGQK